MGCGHQTAGDREIIMQDFDYGGNAVGCAGSIRNKVMFFGVIFFLVDPHDHSRLSPLAGAEMMTFFAPPWKWA
jgi:hypothetical protein